MQASETIETTNRLMDRFVSINRILEQYAYNSSKLIPILAAVQHEFNYLPRELITYVATALNMPVANVYGVATFYAHFALEPKGKHVLRVCDGTACHVKGSMKIMDALREKLALAPGQSTTEDRLFTVETVSCLGACGLAPVMLFNEDVHGQVKPEQALALVDETLAREEKA